MSLHYKPMLALSAVGAYTLVAHLPNLLLFSTRSYFAAFAQLLSLELTIWAFYAVILYPKYLSPLRHLPTPSGNSWWNGQFSRITNEASGAPMREWQRTIPNEGIIRYLGLLNSERLFVTSPKALSEVLTTKNYDFVKPAQFRNGIARVLGYGVLLAEGDEHKMQRKNLMPAFSFRHVKSLYPIFWNIARQSVVAMMEQVEAGGSSEEELGDIKKSTDLAEGEVVIEVGSWCSRATLDIVGVAGLGKEFGAISNPDNLLNQTYRAVFKPNRAAFVMLVLGVLVPSWIIERLPMKRNGQIRKSVAIIRGECQKLILEKKEKLEKNALHDIDILSVALESGAFSDENMIDQLMTFLAAGHETTATIMTWAIYGLCQNPEIQTRLREEVRSRLPSITGGAEITSQDIDSMPYLNAVCSEVIRYFPSVPLTFRDAVVDTTILGHHIPKGTRIIICPWATNRHQALWGDSADTFDPTRWLASESNPQSANGGAASNYSMLTFLHGPRSCIASGFAKAEFACLLAAWVGRFEWRFNDMEFMDLDNVKIIGGITAKPEKGLWVRVKVVEGW